MDDAMAKQQQWLNSTRRRALGWALLTLIVALAAVIWLTKLWSQYHIREHRTQVEDMAESYAYNLTASFTHHFLLLDSLHATAANHVQMGNPISEQVFEGFARSLYDKAPAVRVLTLAPKGVNHFVYPLKDNKQVLGHDLLADARPEVQGDVQRTIDSGDIVLSGPYELRQTGQGLVARRAIYAEDGEFWGLATIVLDLPSIWDTVGLAQQDTLWITVLDSNGQTVYGPDIVSLNPVAHRVRLPGETWELLAVPRLGWFDAVLEETLAFMVGGVLTAAILAGAAYGLTHRHLRLKETAAIQKAAREQLMRRQALAYRIAEWGAESLALDSWLHRVHQELRAVVDAETIYVSLYDPEQDWQELVYAVDPHFPEIGNRLHDTYPEQDELTKYVIEKGEITLLSRTELAALQQELDLAPWPHLTETWLGVPMRRGQEVRGVLVLESDRPDAYSSEDVSLLAFVAAEVMATVDQVYAERILQDAQKRFQLFYQNAPMPYQSLDKEGVILEVNQAWLNLLGYTREQVIGAPFADLVIPDERQRFHTAFAHFQKQGEVHGVTYTLRAKDGHSVYVAIDGHVSRDRQGQFRRSHCVLADLTTRRQQELRQTVAYRIAALSIREQTLQELLAEIHKELNQVLQAGSFYVALCIDGDPETYSFPYVIDERPAVYAEPLTMPLHSPTSLTAYTLRHGKAKLLRRSQIETLLTEGEVADIGPLCEVWMGVPLHAEEKLIGLIAVQSYDDPEAYDEQDLDFVRFVSDQIAGVIERKRAEESLKQNERRYRSLFENTLDAILLADDEARYVDANPAACALLGYTREELLGMHLWDLTPNANRALGEKMWATYLEQGEMSGEYTIQRKDGTFIVAQFQAVAGILPGLHLSSMRDVTQQRQAEEELAASEARYRSMVEALPDMVVRFDAQDHYVDIHPALEWDPIAPTKSLLGQPVGEVLTAKEWERLQALHKQARETGRPQTFAYTLKEDGEKRYYESRFAATDKGEIVGIVRDSTKARQAEEALAASEARYRQTLEALPDMIYRLDENNLILDIKPPVTWEMIQPVETLIGKPAGGPLSEADRKTFHAALNRARETGSPQTYEYSLVQDGERHYFEGRATPAADNTIIGIIRDVTEQRQAEAALLESEHQNEALIAAIPDLLYRMRPDGTYTYFKPARDWGPLLPADRFVGNRIQDLLDGESAQRVLPNIQRTLDSGRAHSFEYDLVEDGEIRYYESRLLPAGPDEILGIVRDVTELRRKERTLLESTQRLSLLYDAGRALNRSLDQRTIYQTLYELIAKAMDCTSLYVSRVEAETDLIHPAYAFQDGHSLDTTQLPPLPLSPEGGTQSRVIRSGEPLILDDYQEAIKDSRQVYDGDGSAPKGQVIDKDTVPERGDVIRSKALVPLKLEEQVIGVIQVGSLKPNAYEEGDLRTLESLATYAAVAIKNAQLYEQAQAEIAERRRLQRRQALAYRIAELTNAGLDFRQLLVGIHRELDAVLNAGNFYIALYDREQALIRFPYMVDEGEAGPEPVFDTARAFGNSATEYVIRKGEPVLWNAKEIREHMAAGDIHETDEIPAAWLSVPFRNNDGQVIGVVTVQSYKDPAAYGTEDVELLAFVSGQIADAVRHARADVALAESERRYRLVAENVSDVIWTADVDGKFTYVSPSVWDLIRYEPEELEGSKLEALIGIVEPKSRATAQELLTSLEQAIEDPDGRPSEPWIATIEARAKDGLPVWTESHVSLLYNEDGNVIGLLGSTRDVTARQEAEEAMQASEERFRMLYESVQAGVLVRSNKGRIIQANQTAAEMLGLSLDELYRCSEEEFDWNAIQSDGTPVSASDLPFMHTIQTGEPVRHAVRGVFANDPNHFRWLLINTEPLTDAAGNLLEVITTFTDITPLKETQEALRRSQELLQETGRMAHVGGWEVRLPGWELVWTDEVYRIYGLDPEMPAPSLEEAVKFFAPDDQPRIMAAVEQAIAKDGSFDLELELITAQDEHRWTHAQGWGERDQHGDIKRVYGTFQDVTTRHEAEAELRRSENTLRALLNAMDAMALLVDLEGTILAANENTAAYLDVSVEQLIGSKGQRILPSEIADKLVIRAEEAIASTRPVRSEDEWGDRILAHTIYPILSSQGRVERLAIYIRDVTEEREIEAHLQQTTKMEALGRLAGGVAHDFNNLLTVMTSYSDMLLAEPEMPEPLKADITEISQAADQAASLTHQLLAFSRKQMLEPERMSLNKVVEGMETMLRRLLSEDIKLCVDLAPEMGHVKADPGQIGQVIVNLVVNARDAMPQGGRLDIRTRHVSLDADDVEMLDLTPGRYVTLIVQDTGTGIAEDVLPHIFDPFYTTKAHGTGLGLATVYGIVTQSGGDVVVETQEGAGSTFIIYLPSVDAPAITEISEAARPETGSETILLVEDEDVIRALARRILSRNGYHVLEASDAAAALERYAENDGRIDLLLTDVVMPEMDGAQLAEHLRHQHPDLPVLFMSGYTDDVLSQRGLHEENEELLSKPFTPTSLACRVRNVLDRNGQK